MTQFQPVPQDQTLTSPQALLQAVPAAIRRPAAPEAVGHAVNMPGVPNYTMAVFPADVVPSGELLFLKQPPPEYTNPFGILVEFSDGTTDFRRVGDAFEPTLLAFSARYLFDVSQPVREAVRPHVPFTHSAPPAVVDPTAVSLANEHLSRAMRALVRLENACSRRAALGSKAAHDESMKTLGMAEVLLELDQARSDARQLLKAYPMLSIPIEPANAAAVPAQTDFST